MKKLFSLLVLLLTGVCPAQNPNPQSNWSSQVSYSSPEDWLTFNQLGTPFLDSVTGTSWTATGTITTGQPGFDASNPQQYSASFPYNAYLTAPSDALGDFEWTQPWSMVLQIDNLQYSGTGTKILISKGQLGGSTTRYWELTIGTGAQFCFSVQGEGGSVTSHTTTNQGICSAATNLYPNGYNYNIIVTYDGWGGPGYRSYPAHTSMAMYINGQPSGANTNTALYAPGSLVVVGSGGTGYPNSFPVTLSTLAPNATCLYLGQGVASSGVVTGPTALVPAAVSSSGQNSGCTSAYTVIASPYYVVVNTNPTATSTFTSTGGGTGCSLSGSVTTAGVVTYYTATNCSSAPTLVVTGTGTYTVTANPGSGATFTSSMFGATLSTATTNPVVISGGNVGGTYQGFSTTSSDSPMNVDEVAIFPFGLTETQAENFFYQTKLYQTMLYSLPRIKLVFDNDYGDADNIWLLAFDIALHKAGVVNLQAVIVEDGAPCAFGLYRQMLDQAGLNNIPVARPSSFTVTTACTSGLYSNLTTFNASTDLTVSDYPTAASVYRTIMAANPSTPIYVTLTGGVRGYVDFMQSAADGISSMTGLQLQAQNATNGAKLFLQGACAPFTGSSPCSITSDNLLLDWTAGQYLVANNCTVSPCIPMIWTGGTPQQSGPGPLYTLTAKSPAYLYAVYQGLDTRQAYDSLALAQALSPLFTGGVQIAVNGTGITGCAASTPFTLSGGTGVGSGVMVSSGGVPSSITYPAYATTGIGYGYGNGTMPTVNLVGSTCSAPPTFTVTPTLICGHVVITSATAGTNTAASCSTYQQYAQYTGNNAVTGLPPLLTWFLSSLIDRPPQGQVRPQ